MPILPGQELGPGGLCCAGRYVLLCFPTMKKSARVQPDNFTVLAAASLHPRFIGMWCHLFFLYHVLQIWPRGGEDLLTGRDQPLSQEP